MSLLWHSVGLIHGPETFKAKKLKKKKKGSLEYRKREKVKEVALCSSHIYKIGKGEKPAKEPAKSSL